MSSSLPRDGRPRHGHSKSGEAQFGKEVVEFEGVFAESCGEAGDFEDSQKVDRRIPQNAHRLRRTARTDATVVFSHHRVLDPEQTFDRPAASQKGQQPGPVSLFSRQARDAVRHRACGLAVHCRDAFQFQEAIQTRPTSVFHAPSAGPQNASLYAAAPLLARFDHPNLFFRFTSGVGGKSPSGSRRTAERLCADWVDCLSRQKRNRLYRKRSFDTYFAGNTRHRR